jgi:hypothetical protein
MRTLLVLVLVLVAAVGLPLYALAQPVADDGKSTDVSGLTVEALKATECPLGDSHFSGKRYDAPPDTKNKRTEESAGTRALILMIIAGQRDNNIAYTHIDPRLAKLVRAQGPHINLVVGCQGTFKGIKFLHVSQDGWDDFEVDFRNGALEWAIKPFNSHQVTEGIVFRLFYPQPATKPFEDLLKSMERGEPNYADLTPDFTSKLEARWPALQKSLKDWGRLKGFRFVRQEDDGSYVYLATYEHHQVVWTALPPNADGKFTALTYDEKAG